MNPEKIKRMRDVWAAATEMQRTQGRITITGVMGISKIPSTSFTRNCMLDLVDMGYMLKGLKGEHSWKILVPFVDYFEENTNEEDCTVST